MSVDPDAAGTDLTLLLLSAGVDQADIDRAIDLGLVELLAIEHFVIGGTPQYTASEMANAMGIELSLAQDLWRALGFPNPGPNAKAFSSTDMHMTARVVDLLDDGLTDWDVVLQMTRVVGSSIARVANAQVEAAVELAHNGSPSGSRRSARLLELLPEVLEYSWRRHLQAAARRRLMRDPTGDDTLVVGFADLVGFTSLSQQLDGAELAKVVRRFEEVAYGVVTEGGGRVVKMIGDEVMFSVDDPMEAALIGLSLADAYRSDQMLSDVRVGLATGPVLEQEGDLFGPAVNLASRIVAEAYPGTVLAGAGVYAVLADAEGLHWQALKSRHLKGIGRVEIYSLFGSEEEMSESLIDRLRRLSTLQREWISERLNAIPLVDLGATGDEGVLALESGFDHDYTADAPHDDAADLDGDDAADPDTGTES